MQKPKSQFSNPLTPADLMTKIGLSGAYQNHIFIVFALMWYIVYIITLQTPFLFLQPQFLIESTGDQSDLFKMCSLNKNQRNLKIDQSSIFSINAEYGPFVCQDQYILGYLKSIVYLGTLFGFFFFSHMMDNIGRKQALLMTWGTTTLGSAMLAISNSLAIVCLGLFLTGAGRSVTRVTITIINQIFNDSSRQKISVILQFFVGCSGFGIALGYYFIRDWRNFNIYMILIPSVFVMLYVWAYFEDTPAFLLLKDKQIALQAFNRIGKINKGQQNILTLKEIQNCQNNLPLSAKKQFKIITFRHLITLPSLKTKTIAMCIIFFGLSFLYYGPIFIIDKLNLNIYTSMIVFSLVEFIIGPLSMLTVQKLQRKKTGLLMFSASTVLTGTLLFVQAPANCNNCLQGFIEVFCVFGSRLCITFYYTLIFLYGNQLFPIRARGLGMGLGSAIGTISSVFGNIVIGIFDQLGLNIMILFTGLGFLLIYGVTLLPETLNKPMISQIQQFQQKRLLVDDSIQMKQFSSKVKKLDSTSTQDSYSPMKKIDESQN